MKKTEARQLLELGMINLGHLRKIVATDISIYGVSTVNRSLMKSVSVDILRKAIDADKRPDETLMNGPRDRLTGTNVIREFGLFALIKAVAP